MQKIRTALLSYGSSGKLFHAPFLALHPGFELTGAWERSKKMIEADYPNVKSYSALDEVLADDIDLVIVNTPTATHFEYAKAALLAGKDVAVEKAFTTNAQEARKLKFIAEQHQRKISVFHNRRWDSDFQTVKNVIDKGLLGELVEAEIHFDRYNPSASPKAHKETVSAGSGILKDLGPHIIDQALVLFGFPDGVYADIRYTRKGTLVDDWIDIQLHYQHFRVRLKAGFLVREPVPSYIFHGLNGSFLKSRGDVQEDDLRAGKKPDRPDWGHEPVENQGVLHTMTESGGIRENVPTIPGNYYHYFEGLYQYLAHDQTAPVSAREGIDVMRVIDAAIESDIQKKIIYFND